MDPINDQDLPIENLIENEDGSVDIEELGEESTDGEFSENLALKLPKSTLDSLALDFLDKLDRDREDRKLRDKQYDEGIRRTGMGDDAPGGADFEGASRAVHPVLAEACVDFSARAIKEIFPPQGPVKTAVVGLTTEEQLDRAERKRTFLNWQLTTQMQEYRSEIEQLLTQLPLGGSQFQKFRQDDRLRRPVAEFVPVDDMLLPYSATSFYTATRVTHVQHLTAQELEDRILSGLYREIPVSATVGTTEKTLSQESSEKVEGKEESVDNTDGLRDVYEIYCTIRLEDPLVPEDEYAPYIITIDSDSREVLAIYRNWEEGDEKLEKLDWIVEWKFIPWRGAYAIGFPQLIGSLSAAATGALRALLDSAHINNLPSVARMKSGISGQQVVMNPTGMTEIEGSPGIDDIRKILMPMPFNPPSGVLFQLLGWLTDAAKNVVRTTENAIQNAGDRTPVGTTQAMIEQGSAIYSAIHARLHESQKKALAILSRINRTWMDEEVQVEELGKLIIRREDFLGSMDVIPVSDPAIFSEAQRYAQNQSLLQMSAQDAQDPSIPWNKLALRRRMLKQLRIDNIDEILPLPPKPLSSDPLTEISTLLSGKPIQAVLPQNHMSHIQAHLAYLTMPGVLQNPLIPGPALMTLLQHVQNHLDLLTQQIIQMTAQQLSGVIQTDPDTLMAEAIQRSSPVIAQMTAPALQAMSQIHPAIQAKMPQPPMPPEIQASIKIAELETNRKAQLDKATIDLKTQQQASDRQLEGFKLQMDQVQAKFDQFIEHQRLALEDQSNALTAQVELMKNRLDNEQKQMTELMKNRLDNEQKQMTELVKNRDDNQTKLLIELKSRVESMAAPAEAPQVDLTPQVEKMQAMLDQLNQSKTNDALASVIQGLQTTIETLQRPRRTQIEEDANGKPLAAVSNLV